MPHVAAKARQQTTYTVQEYFALETANADAKYEFFDGEIVAMAGAQPEHNSVCSNLIREIGNQIIRHKKPCRVYPSDQRVKSERKQSGRLGYFYPDVSVVCGKPEFADDNPQTLLNATVVIEVLSDSTYQYDFHKKRLFYAAQASVKEMLFVNYETASVLCISRSGEQWVISDYQLLKDKIELRSIGIALPMKEIYRDIEFPKPTKKMIKTLVR
jgi:Uma2 family endonuclease